MIMEVYTSDQELNSIKLKCSKRLNNNLSHTSSLKVSIRLHDPDWIKVDLFKQTQLTNNVV